ncbi:MAG: hypothetical protein AMXMBFR56_29340 [Polyangiaceae bacterium]
MSLTSRVQTERDQALAAVRSEEAAKVESLRARQRRELEAATQEQAAAVAAAEHAKAAAEQALHEELAGACLKSFTAIASEIEREGVTRGLARRFAEEIVTHDRAISVALGSELRSRHIGAGFALALYPDLPHAFGANHVWNADGSGCGTLCEAALKAARDGNVPKLEETLRALEQRITKWAKQAVPSEPLAERFELANLCATEAEALRRLDVFDREAAAERQRVFEATYQPPAGARIAT